MIFGKVRCGFFQELVFHLQFPIFLLKLTQARPLAKGQGRFLAGVLTAVGTNPISEGTFVNTQLLFATRAIGRDVSITIFTASSLNSGEKLFFGRGKNFTFPDCEGYSGRPVEVQADCR